MPKRSDISNALPVIRIKPPKWTEIFTSNEPGDRPGGFTFDNVFVYNFFTMGERDRYNFRNPEFSLNHVESSERSRRIIRDFSGKVLNNNLLKKARENIPSFINLSWDAPEGFNNNRASEESVGAFKVLAGLAEDRENVFRVKPVSQESFELQQSDFINMTNEYLDMFSWSNGKVVNQYFAEEIDGSGDMERIEFLEDFIMQYSAKYKNAVYQTKSGGNDNINNYRARLPSSQKSKLTGNPINPLPIHSVVDVNDSSLLENLEFPDLLETSDIVAAYNSDFSWNVAQASKSNSGLILGTQTRMRNSRFWLEYIAKFGKENNDPLSRAIPLDSVIENTFPFKIEDISELSVAGGPFFELVGFVIEKKQIIEPAEHAERDSQREIKFPLIFVPRNPDTTEVNSNYLDAAINYDKEYEYSVRAVFAMTIDLEVLENERLSRKRLKYFVNSSFSQKLVVETREVSPPPYPRDVWAFHEYYRDTEGALALHWAFPVNKQRDTAYFAIFKRKSIYEPFQLQEIIDFNFSISDPGRSAMEIKLAGLGRDPTTHRDDINITPQREYIINKVRRLRPGDPNTVYIDKDFLPGKDYIYAVCAIDAHGQISNYSSQIKVNLSVKPYKLEVRTISPPGAPLVFPNYYIKSKMFLDVARTARYRKATLRFRPDYKRVRLDENKIINIVNSTSQNSINSYYLQIINPDLGKQILLKYKIDDTVEAIVDAEERRIVASQLGIPLSDLLE